MKNFLLFLLLAIFAFTAKANTKKFLVYGSLQAERDYTELGYQNNGEVRYVHDFESTPYGLGAEWRFQDDGKFFFGAGAHYQTHIKVKQNTTFLNQNEDPSSFTSRDDLQHISFLHGYFNVYSRVNDGLAFFLGLQYTVPDWRSHGRFDKYRMENGIGYRTGVEMNLTDSWISQIYYRHVLLETEDQNNYGGEINISSLMLTIGYGF